MARNKTTREPLPKSFKTIDAFVGFWDRHSTADYPEAFREIKESVRLRQRRYYRVALIEKIGVPLARRARAKGMTLDALVNQMLEKSIERAA